MAEREQERQDREALRENEERYQLIVEAARDYAIITTDDDGRITSWSPGAEAVFGWPAEKIVGEPVDMTFVPEDRARDVPAAERRMAREQGMAPDVRWHLCEDGGRVFVDGTTRVLRDGEGHPRGFLKIGQDVTRRREMEQALLASEARYRALVENVHDYAIFLLDARGVVTEWTPGAERVKGYKAADVLGRHVSMFYTPEGVTAGEPERELAEATASGRAERESWRVRADGSRFWVNEVMTAIRNPDGELIGFAKVSRDLTERRVAQAAAERVRAEAERLALRRQLVAAEEDERRRLARELHDQLGQQLTAFSLGLNDAQRLAAESGTASEALTRRLVHLEALARSMTAGMRDLALELRPPELDDLGLASAVRTYVTEWSARYDIEIDVAMRGLSDGAVSDGAVSGGAVSDGAVSSEVGTALYRIVQEALTNVARHAEASHVSVIVERRDSEILLVVEDDGRGFDVAPTLDRARRERRLGLAGMRERAELAGGTLAVESRPGGGTTLFVRLPLDRQPPASSMPD